MPDFTIRDHPDKSRYEMIVGGTLAGYVRYWHPSVSRRVMKRAGAGF